MCVMDGATTCGNRVMELRKLYLFTSKVSPLWDCRLQRAQSRSADPGSILCIYTFSLNLMSSPYSPMVVTVWSSFSYPRTFADENCGVDLLETRLERRMNAMSWLLRKHWNHVGYFLSFTISNIDSMHCHLFRFCLRFRFHCSSVICMSCNLYRSWVFISPFVYRLNTSWNVVIDHNFLFCYRWLVVTMRLVLMFPLS